MIRKCQKEDEDSVYRLICQLKNDEIDYLDFRLAFENKILDKRSHYIVAVEDNLIIGFLSLEVDYQLQYAKKVATIEEFIVDANFREKGIGKKLLNEAINYVKGDCYAIELTSGFFRRQAHQFYEKNGFIKISYKFKKEL